MRTDWRPKVKKFYKLNNQISANEVRVIDEKGKQVGILPIDEARRLAQEKALDLVEIAADAKPPVIRLIEFKKFKYLEERKQREARRHTRETELKEVRFSPFIGDHDFNTALDRAKKFLSEGDFVIVSIRFKGRQMAHTEFGPKLLSRILASLGGVAEQDRQERFEGRQFTTILRPAKNAPKPKE